MVVIAYCREAGRKGGEIEAMSQLSLVFRWPGHIGCPTYPYYSALPCSRSSPFLIPPSPLSLLLPLPLPTLPLPPPPSLPLPRLSLPSSTPPSLPLPSHFFKLHIGPSPLPSILPPLPSPSFLALSPSLTWHNKLPVICTTNLTPITNSFSFYN